MGISNALTALYKNNTPTNVQELFPLHMSTDGTLETPSLNLLLHIQHQPASEDTSPPGLNLNRCSTQLAIVVHRHLAPHVLLDHGDHRIEPLRAHRLEGSEHASTEEDLGQTILVHVRVGYCLLEDDTAEAVEVHGLDHGLPGGRGNKHIVSGRT